MAFRSSTHAWVLQWVLSVGIILSDPAVSLGAEASHQLFRRNGQPNDTLSTQKTAPHFESSNGFREFSPAYPEECFMDRSQHPELEQLVKCRDSSMFSIWRPQARLLAPRGWMNDPMGIYQTKNGSYHIGYQCNPDRIVWANISQCSASTHDFVHFNDYGSWKDPVTIAPSQLYDIRGVFDGTIIQNGWNGNPSIIYTSTFTGPLGAKSNPPEREGIETQSIAYTENDGLTWTKLNFGAMGNPVLYKWPEKHLSGFRDPFVFESPDFTNFYANTSIDHQLPGDSGALRPTGKLYLLISGGIRVEADPTNGGPRLFLYRQTEENNIRDWTYLGPLLSFPAEYFPPSDWTGPLGINFECGGLSKINEYGRVTGDTPSSDSAQLNILTMGTEGARNSTHSFGWPVWQAVSFDYTASDGNVRAKVDFSGVIDWGMAYAFFFFHSGTRQMAVGWTYEDDDSNVLTRQRGAQGAFTLFREVFVKVVRNVHPIALHTPQRAPSWAARSEPDGTKSIVTVGQKILPEIIAAFRNSSTVSPLKDRTLDLASISNLLPHENVPTNLVKFETQPKDRYYAISAQLDFLGSRVDTAGEGIPTSGTVRGGFRILASEKEWTDIYFDPAQESLIIDRSSSSAISCYGNSTEQAKHRLWPILDPATNQTKLESLNLTIIIDNSVIEVHANERSIITTRVYPWYHNSIGVHFLVQGPPKASEDLHSPKVAGLSDDTKSSASNETTHLRTASVRYSNVELWDGLLNAWPNRPSDTSLPGTNTNNLTSTLYDLWPEPSNQILH